MNLSSLLFSTYCVSFVLAQNNTRNYTVGIKVNSLWYSGSQDTMYFEICNVECLKWYEMSGGMANKGDWYYFDYLQQPDIGTPTSMRILTEDNDQFCISQVSVDGVKYDDTTIDCIEVSDTKPDGSCSVIDIAFGNAPNGEFTGTLYGDADCPYDLTDIYSSVSPITTANGTRTYELSLTVSSWVSSGTSDDLYLRLCTDESRIDCTIQCDDAMTNCESDWYTFSGGVNEEGDTYIGYWNTKDIGDANYADIVTFGSDTFCLSRLMVDGITADAGVVFPECISDETQDGCTTLSIDLSQSVFTSSSVDQCSYGLLNNETFTAVDKYEFTFKIGSFPTCGAESTIFFIFCAIDGGTASTEYCSSIYEIGGEMPEEGEEYSYTIDVTQYGVFNTLSDVYFVDVWEYDTETWCLSDITINGIILDQESTVNGPNADSTPALQMESDVNDGVYCNGVRVYMQTNVWDEFTDGPINQYKIKKCRWNDLKETDGTVEVSKKSDEQTFWDWMEAGYNWIYICLVLIGIVICCIVCCACLQQMKKKQQGEADDSNKPWHGGNSAFY